MASPSDPFSSLGLSSSGSSPAAERAVTARGLFYAALRPVHHFLLVLSAETKRLVAYRLQFWCELLLTSIIEVIVAVAVWRAVFEGRNFEVLHGYTFQAMVLYATVAVFFGQAVRGTSVGTFARDIYDGGLTKYLVYPLSIYSYKLGTFFPRALFAFFQLLIALVALHILGYWEGASTASLLSIAASILAVCLGAIVYFLLLLCIESLAFWADNVWALSVMLYSIVMLLGGKLIPLELFPDALRTALLYTPFPYMVFFPVKMFLGQVSLGEALWAFIVLPVWIVIAFALSRAAFQRGLYRYSGVGM